MSRPPLPREFADRTALVDFVRTEFADILAADDHDVAPQRGGRQAALAQLARIKPKHPQRP